MVRTTGTAQTRRIPIITTHAAVLRWAALVTSHGEIDSLLSVFHLAFKDGLRALETQIKHIQSLGKEFAILFMGGSLRIPGLRNKVADLVARLGSQQRSGVGGQIRHGFLRVTDYHPEVPLHILERTCLTSRCTIGHQSCR